MILSIFFLTIGFILLIKGADLFVSGSSSLALRIRIPAVIIGLTIVAFGTSAPELFVSSISSLKGVNDIAIGNVIGSNIFNIVFIIGISGILGNLTFSTIMRTDMLILIIISIILFFITLTEKKITRKEGLFLFTLYLFYLIFIIIRG